MLYCMILFFNVVETLFRQFKLVRISDFKSHGFMFNLIFFIYDLAITIAYFFFIFFLEIDLISLYVEVSFIYRFPVEGLVEKVFFIKSLYLYINFFWSRKLIEEVSLYKYVHSTHPNFLNHVLRPDQTWIFIIVWAYITLRCLLPF
jgi:hypothetical protein